jgi:electron transfer flavoprotein alpha subunit
MPTTLVLLDHGSAGELRPTTLEVLTAARGLGPVEALWVGGGLDGALEVLGAAGVDRVHHAVPTGDDRWPPVVAECVSKVQDLVGAPLVLLAATHEGTEVAAGYAARVGAAVVTDADRVEAREDGLVVTKSVLAGTWVTQVLVTAAVAVVTLEPNAVRAEPADVAVATQVVELPVTSSDLARLVRVDERAARAATGRPDLATADVVVVAGRGVDGHLGPVEELADVLGGAVGATRVVADEGWIAREQQIGQTGVVVSPRLYIGAGVSGAVHHRGGMQSADTIVAINNDPDAPIFEIADYGVVGDVSDVLPQLTAELRRLREQG